MTVINKFGGGPVNGVEPIKRLPLIFKEIIKEDSINVFSAFGKTTNNLEALVQASLRDDNFEARKQMSQLEEFHKNIINGLSFPENHPIFSKVEKIFQNIKITLYYSSRHKYLGFMSDQILPYGEMLASVIVNEYLTISGVENQLINATDFIMTDDQFGNAEINRKDTTLLMQEKFTCEVLKKSKNIITQGFIGTFFTSSDDELLCLKMVTTLGREGSDYTAGLIGNIMNASKVVLWKDVPGLMTQDPKNEKGKNFAKLIPDISFNGLESLLRKDRAKGLVHPKTLNEVRSKKIPLQIRPFWDLESEGTLIH